MSGAQEGAGRVRNLGTELAEARAESRRGRTLSGLIAEGGLSHGVHVRAHREGRERRGKSACWERKFTRRRGGSKSWTLDPSISCQGFGYPVSHPSPRRSGSEGCTSSSPWPASPDLALNPNVRSAPGTLRLGDWTTRWPVGAVPLGDNYSVCEVVPGILSGGVPAPLDWASLCLWNLMTNPPILSTVIIVY